MMIVRMIRAVRMEFNTLFWAFSDGVRLLWMVVNAQEHHKCVSNQSCLTRSWQQDGVSVGVPSDVIDRWRILWIFGFGHHKHHKGRGHNQEKSVQCLCQKSDIAASDASTLKSIREICLFTIHFQFYLITDRSCPHSKSMTLPRTYLKQFRA